MTALILAMPGLHAHPGLDAGAWPVDGEAEVLARLLARGARRVLATGWRSHVLARCGAAQLARCAPGRLAALAAASAADDPVWLATPVHLDARHDHVVLGAHGILRLSDAESSDLTADFARAFPETSAALWSDEGGGLLLRGLEASDVATHDPVRWRGGDIAAALPHGAGAPAVKRMWAEIELWLHGHAVNRARAARGEPVVSALWLWGGAGEAVPPAPAPGPWPVGFGDDPVLRGAWRWAGGRLEAAVSGVAVALAHTVEDADSIVVVDHTPPPTSAIGQAAGEIAAALDALRSGRLSRVEFLANDRCFAFGRVDAWKPWRRAGTLATQIA
jgi:hypothetical protein